MMPLQEHGIRQSAAASLQPQRASNVMGMSLQPWQISTKSVNHVPAAHKPCLLIRAAVDWSLIASGSYKAMFQQ
jgi:hypothetical protein